MSLTALPIPRWQPLTSEQLGAFLEKVRDWEPLDLAAIFDALDQVLGEQRPEADALNVISEGVSGGYWQALGLARRMAWTTCDLAERLLAVEGIWGWHVNQREPYRMFDDARLLLEGEQIPRTGPERGRDRLRRATLGPLGTRPSQDRGKAPAQAQRLPTGLERVRWVRTTRRLSVQDQRRTSVRARWILEAADGGNPQDDSDSGNKHGGGGSDEGGNTNDGQGPADGR